MVENAPVTPPPDLFTLTAPATDQQTHAPILPHAVSPSPPSVLSTLNTTMESHSCHLYPWRPH